MEPARKSKAIDMNASYLGVEPLMLMENAGCQVARHARKFDAIAIFAGLGNNGGDGLVAARHLAGLGKKVSVYTLKGDRSAECQRNYDILEGLDSVEIEFVWDSSDCEKIDLSGFDVVVDSLLGVGARGDIREPVKSMVDLINKAKAYKIAVDCPTPGLDADLALAFHFSKNKDDKVVGIGIPPEAESLCGPGDVYLAMPPRGGGEHKGDFGKVIVVGGSRNFVGTPALVGKAALRTGADLAVLCCPQYAADRMPADPNLIVHSLESEYFFEKKDVSSILDLDFDSLVVGNGLSTHDETRHALKKLLGKVDKPVVLDADALKLVKSKQLREGFIVTPHAYEFEVLFGDTPERQNAMRCAAETGAVVVLKGREDIITDGEKTKINKTGNPGMTVGGTGDVLAGIIGALSCKTEAFDAATAGAFLCGLAGDLAASELGNSLIATDCIEKIPYAIGSCEGYP